MDSILLLLLLGYRGHLSSLMWPCKSIARCALPPQTAGNLYPLDISFILSVSVLWCGEFFFFHRIIGGTVCVNAEERDTTKELFPPHSLGATTKEKDGTIEQLQERDRANNGSAECTVGYIRTIDIYISLSFFLGSSFPFFCPAVCANSKLDRRDRGRINQINDGTRQARVRRLLARCWTTTSKSHIVEKRERGGHDVGGSVDG